MNEIPMSSEFYQGVRRQAHFAIIRIPTNQAVAWLNTRPENHERQLHNDDRALYVFVRNQLKAYVGPQYCCPPLRDNAIDQDIIDLHTDVVLLDEGAKFKFTLENSESTRAAMDFLKATHLDTRGLQFLNRVIIDEFGFDYRRGEYESEFWRDDLNALLKYRMRKDEETKRRLQSESQSRFAGGSRAR